MYYIISRHETEEILANSELPEEDKKTFRAFLKNVFENGRDPTETLELLHYYDQHFRWTTPIFKSALQVICQLCMKEHEKRIKGVV